MKKFQRKIEDFVCEKCDFYVEGDGYTNHCPKCLWSRHVDVNPGDREEKCGGMMEPVRISIKKGENYVNHRCVKCDFERVNKVKKEDNFDTIVKISSRYQFDVA